MTPVTHGGRFVIGTTRGRVGWRSLTNANTYERRDWDVDDMIPERQSAGGNPSGGIGCGWSMMRSNNGYRWRNTVTNNTFALAVVLAGLIWGA